MARRRMSGSGLARTLGKSQAWISRRITGDVAFDLDDLESIASVLDVEVATLLGSVTGHLRNRYSPAASVGASSPDARVLQFVRPQRTEIAELARRSA